MKRKVLTANEGKVFSNGEVYGKVIFLAEGTDENLWHEVNESEIPQEEELPDESF